MGDFNYPLPPSIPWDELPPGFRQTYIIKYAMYSDYLFTAISAFYAANAQIQKSILLGSDILLVIDELRKAKAVALHASISLSDVQSMWLSVNFEYSEKPLSFKQQMNLLSKASDSIETAITHIGQIDMSKPIQIQIWSKPALVDSLNGTIELLNQAMNWQLEFVAKYKDNKVIA